MEIIKEENTFGKFLRLVILSIIPYMGILIYFALMLEDKDSKAFEFLDSSGIFALLLLGFFAFRIMCARRAINMGENAAVLEGRESIVNILQIVCLISIVINVIFAIAAICFLPMLFVG